MKTLFIDSSRKNLSIAIVSDNKLISVSNINSYSKHSNYLMNAIIDMLNCIKSKINDIDNIVVLNGPGSFTGVRVGVTIAKTLAYSLNKKIYAINNLEALSIHSSSENIISIIYDKNDASYVGIYSNGKVEEAYFSLNEVEEKLDGVNFEAVSFNENEFVKQLLEFLHPNHTILKIINDYDYVKLVNYAISKGDIDVHLLEPVYLKKIDAEKRKNEN